MNLKDNNDMKKTLYSICTLLILFVVAFSSQSCSGDAQKYTVWTDSGSYTDFVSQFNSTLDDGCYLQIPISNSGWAEMSKGLTSEGRHRWNEETIKKWLVSNDFCEREGTKLASWLVMNDHGMIISRDRNVISMIVK